MSAKYPLHRLTAQFVLALRAYSKLTDLPLFDQRIAHECLVHNVVVSHPRDRRRVERLAELIGFHGKVLSHVPAEEPR